MRGNQNPVMPLRQTWPFYKWEDIAPQLLLAGIHKVCTGIHENGVFYTVEEHDIDHRWLLAKHRRVASNMRKLAGVVKYVRDKSIGLGEPRLSVVHSNGELWLHKRTSRGTLLAEQFHTRFYVQ